MAIIKPPIDPTDKLNEALRAAEDHAQLAAVELPAHTAIHEFARATIASYGQRIVDSVEPPVMAGYSMRENAYAATDWFEDPEQTTESQKVSFRLTRGMQFDSSTYDGIHKDWLYEDKDEFGLWMRVERRGDASADACFTAESLIVSIRNHPNYAKPKFVHDGRMVEKPYDGQDHIGTQPAVQIPPTSHYELGNPAIESTSELFASVKDTLQFIANQAEHSKVRYIGKLAADYRPPQSDGS